MKLNKEQRSRIQLMPLKVEKLERDKINIRLWDAQTVREIRGSLPHGGDQNVADAHNSEIVAEHRQKANYYLCLTKIAKERPVFDRARAWDEEMRERLKRKVFQGAMP